MKAETRFYVVVVVLIVLCDVAGSLVSRALKFDYALLVWPWRFLYAVAGYFGFACVRLNVRLVGGTLAGLVTGVADATAGWALSAVIRPYTRLAQPPLSLGLVAAVIVFISLQAAFFGFIGGLVHLLVDRLRARL